MIEKFRDTISTIPYWLQKTTKINCHEREASVMSKALSLKPEEVYLDTPLRTSRSLYFGVTE